MKTGSERQETAPAQSEIYRGIFDKYGGAGGEISDIYRGHYVCEVFFLSIGFSNIMVS